MMGDVGATASVLPARSQTTTPASETLSPGLPRADVIRLSVLVIAAGLIAAVAVWAISADEWAEATAYWETRLKAAAEHHERIVSSWLNERRGDTSLVASYPTVKALLRPTGHDHGHDLEGHLRAIFGGMKPAYGYSSMHVVDLNGRVVASAGDTETSRQHVAAVAAAALAAGGFTVEEVPGGDVGWSFAMAMPVTAGGPGTESSDPSVTGAVVLVMPPAQSLWPLITSEAAPTGTGETVLFRRDGDAVVAITPLRHSAVARRMPVGGADSVFTPALRGERLFGEFVDYRGVPVLAAVRRLPHLRWGLVTKVDRSEALDPFVTNDHLVASVAAFAVAAFAATAVAVARRRRTRVLAEELARERALREAQTRAERAVQQLNTALEERVRERTAELEAANAELEAFNTSVSHDLRAPLRHIAGFAKILVEDYGAHLPADALAYARRIEGGSARMGLLIDALMKLSQVGRAELRARPVDVAAVVQDAYREQSALSDRAPELIIGDLPTVEGDPVLLRQLFDNLIGNAVKFTQPVADAWIEVGTAHLNGTRALYVRDNGVGFEPAYADKLFGVFQRLHGQDEFAGTGIGLSIVKRIVERHGGRVWAESAPGSGATFYFTLGST
jgi:signal transduction histidine kinase